MDHVVHYTASADTSPATTVCTTLSEIDGLFLSRCDATHQSLDAFFTALSSSGFAAPVPLSRSFSQLCRDISAGTFAGHIDCSNRAPLIGPERAVALAELLARLPADSVRSIDLSGADHRQPPLRQRSEAERRFVLRPDPRGAPDGGPCDLRDADRRQGGA